MEQNQVKIEAKEIHIVDIDQLTPNPRNNNKHSEEQKKRAMKIILKNGFRVPIEVSNRTGFIVCGHLRLEVAKKLGMTQVPVIYQDFKNEALEYAHLTAENELARWAELDKKMLFDTLKEFPDLDTDLLGIEDFKFPEVEKLPGCDEDDTPGLTKDPIVKKGDVWILGNHRLMCGDSTMVDDVNTLMDGCYPDLIHTDPPYGMNAVSKSGVLSKRYGDDIMGDDTPDVAKDSFALVYGMFPDSKHIWWGANYYSSTLPDSECWLVWDKNNGESDQTDCELAWANFRSVVRQFTQASEKAYRVHPTQKPVSLMEWIIRRFKLSSKTIADFFGGSGSSLIAAEKHELKSYIMEFDPKYCDVIIKRYMKYTERDDVYLEATGQKFSEFLPEEDKE